MLRNLLNSLKPQFNIFFKLLNLIFSTIDYMYVLQEEN